MTYDLLIIGGGINGAAIARDAAGRGWKTLLVERDDLASHTSSASSKLIHGGVRYLEFYEFGLVRKALKEREVMLRSAPHIIWPMRFVFPHNHQVRPFWMIRAGLFLYDLIGGRRTLKGTRRLAKANPQYKTPFADPTIRGLVYSDCWVDDARLVVLNAMDAAAKGAEIETRTAIVSAERAGPVWTAQLSDGCEVEARAIVNAAGPWVSEVLGDTLGVQGKAGVRLVRGSHIVVRRLYAGDHAYILQLPDKRVVFTLPYLDKFTLIGTTDIAVENPEDAVMDTNEVDYLCRSVNMYFAIQISSDDVVSLYSGVRSLYDDGAEDSMEVTRDYVLEIDGGGESSDPPLLSVFGGKITTARALAEDAADRLAELTPFSGTAWTRTAKLPGGELGIGFDDFLERIEARYRFLDWEHAKRMARAYGALLPEILGDAENMSDLGEHFGAGLTEREVRYLIDREWARTPEDILWRRSKLGLLMSEDEQARLAEFMTEFSEGVEA
ncbi:glycerol-3-phosphate dehydrogenase [Parasphingopyxis algicola]|uniref:glycerol-3-phosphate dehydrogenase n=1 Tax=Parasphingopyxis algicola TaxID=2026624 RepID=UPI0015A4E665|nr:glycerol-3-phosphate dehydrogenase [Parasphingopyxis algicola]QLC24560.1 glycerol-3-phosphate dehydrogenase [Parasphingopyxis algicola]